MTSGPFSAAQLHDFESSSRLEWLETNGLGSFACGTISGAATRRYHGLLVAATRPPVGRIHMVSKLAETVIGEAGSIPLDTNCFPGLVHPEGHRRLEAVSFTPCPALTYRLDGSCRLTKRIAMPRGLQACVVAYTVTGAEAPVRLDLRPAFTFRDFHQLTRENPHLDPVPGSGADRELVFRPYPGVPALHVYAAGATFIPDPCWIENLVYPAEAERGLPFLEDNWSPGLLSVEIPPGGSWGLVFSSGPLPSSPARTAGRRPSAGSEGSELPERTVDAVELLERELASRERAAGRFAGAGGLLEALARASEAFLVSRGDGASVMAGYPWFEDWGRDTFISLPGLTLTMERPEVAESILLAYAHHLREGLIPNRFPDGGAEPEYNSVDAPLWFIHAAGRLLAHTDDLELFEARLLPAIEAIVEAYSEGTLFGIAMEEDGLIRAGGPGTQLTWMDARVDGEAVTPRHGKPVEIQALWYDALRTLEEVCHELGDPDSGERYGALADRVQASFLEKFWSEELGHCRDVVDIQGGAGVDDALRPNQLFAASLPHPLIEGERARRMLEAVRSRLLTPRGLRTLSPDDADYMSRYAGRPAQRDAAYHQGTVWPWLLGAYCDALVSAGGGWHPEVVREVRSILKGFEAHLSEDGVGFVSEVFEPEPPHGPGGCVAQAWSVAELLRIAAELARRTEKPNKTRNSD